MFKQQVLKPRFFALIILLILTFISFSPSLKNDYVNWDDPVHFLESTAAQPLNWPNLKMMFSETVNTTYIPLTTLSFAVEHQVFKFNPFVSHLINILLHVIVVALVFILCLRLNLTEKAAWIATLLFAIHPMRVESIAWVTERKDVLYAVFYVSALLIYLNYIENKRISMYLLVVVFGFLSMLAKPMALSLPFILILIDWFKGRRDWVRIAIEKLPVFIYVWLLASISVKENHDIFMLKQGILNAVLTFIWSFSFYIFKFLWPIHLTPFYPIPEPIHILNIQFLLSIIVLIGFVTLVMKYKNNRIVVFSAFYFVLSVFFLLRVNSNSLVVVDLVADRFIYLPSLGFCFLIGYTMDLGLARLNAHIRWKRIMSAVLITIGVMLMVKTYEQCKYWKNSLSLWDHILKEAPKATFGYISRGTYYDEHGQYDLALADYNQAVDLFPEYLKTYVRRGILYGKRSEYDLALNDFNRVIKVRPDDWNALSNRGNVYKLQKEFQLAIADYTKSIELNSQQIISFNNRGECYLEFGDFQSALNDFNWVLKLKPNSASAYTNRGIAYLKLNQLDLALEDLNKSLLLNPNFVKTIFHRALVYQLKGENQKAADDFKQVKELMIQLKK